MTTTHETPKTTYSEEIITELHSLLSSRRLSEGEAQSAWSMLSQDARERKQKAPIPPPDPVERWCPETPTPRQRIFLDLYKYREVLYGGAAGGGKTSGALMLASQYLSWPNYHCLILRKTITQAKRSQSILDRAIAWWGQRFHYSKSDLKFTFPSGATIEFGYLKTEAEKHNYQSSEWSTIIWEELTHFSETQYLYLFSRNRTTIDNPVPLRIRGGTNPGGEGHYWVKDRFISERAEHDVLAGTYEDYYESNYTNPRTNEPALFVPARIEDNKHIGPEYEESLEALPEVEREQLKSGDWTIAARGVFRPEWIRHYNVGDGCYHVLNTDLYPLATVRIKECLRTMMIDPAGTGKERADEEKGKPPSYSAVTICDIQLQHRLMFIIHTIRLRGEAPELLQAIDQAIIEWQPNQVGCENTGLGLPIFQILHRNYPHLVIAMEPGGKDKYTRSVPLQKWAEEGKVLFPNQKTLPRKWYGPLVGEMIIWRAKQDETADQIDTLSFQVLNAERHNVQLTGRPVRASRITGRPLG